METNVYLYAIDSLADWEIGFITSELKSRRYFKKDAPELNLITVSDGCKPVSTMGGMQIHPDLSLAEFKSASKNCSKNLNDMLILPGSSKWLEQNHSEILDVASEWIEDGKNVAAICGATIALASSGLLNGIGHTSNDLGFLKQMCSQYTGEKLYQNVPAVTDRNLITASGIAPLEFAYQVIKKLDVFTDDTLNAWYSLYKTQEPKFFLELMNSIAK